MLGRKNQKLDLVFLGKSCFSDALHHYLGSDGTSGVDGFTLLRSSHTSNQRSQIKFNAGSSNINGIHLSKSAANNNFISLNKKKIFCKNVKNKKITFASRQTPRDHSKVHPRHCQGFQKNGWNLLSLICNLNHGLHSDLTSTLSIKLL